MLDIENLRAEVVDKSTLKGLSLTVNAGQVFQHLSMEFAVEARKLLGTSFEGSLG